MMTSFQICLLVVLICQSQTSESNTDNSCDHKATCSECIQTENCAWCMEPVMDSKPRCFHSSLTTSYCSEEYQWNPDNEEKMLSMQELTLPRSSVSESAISSGSHQSVVQMKPQRIALKLRKNQAHQIHIQYAVVEDYPMDVYFLMDLSKSMESDRDKLVKLGELLAQTLPNITSNFRLGFGSFINKVSSSSPGQVESENPCVDCASAYAFKNHMSLDTDAALFSEQLRGVNIASNPDVSGGALEAIMQAIVCRNQIGWRESARRIIVFSSNDGFDHADESKLGAVVPPNDGYCHLDTNGMFTTSRIQDYPSISQIDRKIRASAINVIFAVTSSQRNIYENLSHQVTGSFVGHLGDDSSNVVELVRDEYSKISSSVELKDNSTSDFKLTYSSSCSGKWLPTVKTNKCDGLKVGDVVSFTADIIVTSCLQKEQYWKRKFEIYPVSINQSLIVDVETFCSCPCENSTICTDNNSELERSSYCRADTLSAVDCNGRGDCVDGFCECYKRPYHGEVISGQFCECDNFSCDRHNGQLCSGSDHGTCSCGVCQCEPGWMGDACDCRASNDTCISRPGGEICSGHGTCECGTCRCDVTPDGRFSGRFCEACPTCEVICHKLKNCVQCQMYNTGPLAASGLCAETCTKIPIAGVDKIEADVQTDEHLCTFYDDVDCRFEFVYKDSNTFEVRAQRERECPRPVMPNIYNMGPLSATKPHSNSSNELFTAEEIEVILQDVYKGLKQCKSKEDQLKLLILLTVKYIYRQQP